MNLRLLLTLVLTGSLTSIMAQDGSNIKFGQITPRDFEPTVYSIDSSAAAVIIADIGATKIVGNQKGAFSLEFNNYRRARILNKNGYDIADVTINVYTSGEDEEKLDALKAVTYNLVNGKVVETKLDVKSVFKDKISKNLVVKKFTFPNIKEGSIIEYEYRVNSDFVFNFQPWIFQGLYPCLWSEYKASIPEFYYYVILSQGYQPFFIKDRKDTRDQYTLSNSAGASASQRQSFSCNVVDYRWAMRNIPALKEESYTTTLQNHISKVEFQLAEIRNPFSPQDIMGTWESVSDKMMKAEDFGLQLGGDNGWLNDAYRDATVGAKNNLEKAQKIFAYIRDNMTCTNYNRVALEKNLRNVLRTRNGNEAEINLLLTAMLKKADLVADPVLLSTRSHGYAYSMYPLMDRFNYVISKLSLDGKDYFLDASQPRMGFGRLGYECYNGHARVINQAATPVDFSPDSLVESKITSLFVINGNNGNFLGTLQQTPGYYESNSIRARVKEKGREQFFNDYKKAFNNEVEITNESIDSLNKYDDPIALKYDFTMKYEKEGLLYLNPMFSEGWKENPFKSAQRFYPVEMPYAIDETYLLRLDVPEGYVVDELPKQVLLKLNENDDGMFEYRINESNGVISLRSRLRIKRAYFLPEEYDMLREFFSFVVKKHSEQIVFKKKN